MPKSDEGFSSFEDSPPNKRESAALPGTGFLRSLFGLNLVLVEDWQALPQVVRDDLKRRTEHQALLAGLVQHALLTQYQADRIACGTIHGLVLGNYRVLDRLGVGGMGVVFRAEHLLMRRIVAIKVLPLVEDYDPRLLQRFFNEMRASAQLQHPNIVSALDAGTIPGDAPDSPTLHYFVMEYVPGRDLEAMVQAEGPLPIARACELALQVAGALAEAYKHNLIHRDIKPSNILVTTEGQAKLLDFGLARHFHRRVTEPGVALGTIDYMAPEQAQDAASVDIRADIYGLGGTLFWCLTGHVPFPSQGNIVRDLAYRSMRPPPSVGAARPEVPAGLDAVLARMMALDPINRYATPQGVMRALVPFIQPDQQGPYPYSASAAASSSRPITDPPSNENRRPHRVLIVDDEREARMFCRDTLQSDLLTCDECVSGLEALEALQTNVYDLVLLDICMPGMSGLEVLRRLRQDPARCRVRVIVYSGSAPADEMAELLEAGADDYLAKPYSVVQLKSRVQAALRLKDAQEMAEGLNQHFRSLTAELEQNLSAREHDLLRAHSALVLLVTRIIEQHEVEKRGHMLRLPRYCRCLAEVAAGLPEFAAQIDASFIQTLECFAPLHDIGKLIVPHHILHKLGKLDAEERLHMETHVTIGAEILEDIVREHGSAMKFLPVAVAIVRHHHEHYDGTGYPDRLSGNDIPLAARIVAIADNYDARRCRRSYRPGISHAVAVQMLTQNSQGHFDPALIRAFVTCADRFERMFREIPD